MQAALDLGASWVEFDLVENADGALVLSHELTAGGVRLDRLSSTDCRSLGLTFASDLFDLLPPQAGFNIEVKAGLDFRPAAQRLAPVLDFAARASRPFLISSFDPSLSYCCPVPSAWITSEHFPLVTALVTAASLDCALVAHASSVVEAPWSTRRDLAVQAAQVGLWVWGAQPNHLDQLADLPVTAYIADQAHLLA